MVTAFSSDDGERYQCEKCGEVFGDRESADEHEAGCHPMPYM